MIVWKTLQSSVAACYFILAKHTSLLRCHVLLCHIRCPCFSSRQVLKRMECAVQSKNTCKRKYTCKYKYNMFYSLSHICTRTCVSLLTCLFTYRFSVHGCITTQPFKHLTRLRKSPGSLPGRVAASSRCCLRLAGSERHASQGSIR